MTVESSDDGSNWSVVTTSGVQPTNEWSEVTFATVTAQWWRLTVNAQWFYLHEVEFINDASSWVSGAPGGTPPSIVDSDVTAPSNPVQGQLWYDPNAVATLRKYSQDLVGDSTSEVVTHNLNTKDVIVQVYNTASPHDQVTIGINRTDVNSITLATGVALGAGYRVVIMA